MHPRLGELAEKYIQTKKKLSDLESASGFLALTARTINDLRHIIDHICLGVQTEPHDATKAEYLYRQGIEHLREHALNSFENISGRAILKAHQRLQASGFFTDRSKATERHAAAVQSYSL